MECWTRSWIQSLSRSCPTFHRKSKWGVSYQFCVCKNTISTNLVPPPVLLWIESARGDNFSTLFDWGLTVAGSKFCSVTPPTCSYRTCTCTSPPSFLTRCPGKGKRGMYKSTSTPPHAAQSGRCQHAGNAWSIKKCFWLRIVIKNLSTILIRTTPLSYISLSKT